MITATAHNTTPTKTLAFLLPIFYELVETSDWMKVTGCSTPRSALTWVKQTTFVAGSLEAKPFMAIMPGIIEGDKLDIKPDSPPKATAFAPLACKASFCKVREYD
jgi:hypothetical protein